MARPVPVLPTRARLAGVLCACVLAAAFAGCGAEGEQEASLPCAQSATDTKGRLRDREHARRGERDRDRRAGGDGDRGAGGDRHAGGDLDAGADARGDRDHRAHGRADRGAHDGADAREEAAGDEGPRSATVRFPSNASGPLNILYLGDELLGSYRSAITAEIVQHRRTIDQGLQAPDQAKVTANLFSGAPANMDVIFLGVGNHDVPANTSAASFGRAYAGLVASVRAKSPDATLICLGTGACPRGRRQAARPADRAPLPRRQVRARRQRTEPAGDRHRGARQAALLEARAERRRAPAGALRSDVRGRSARSG